MSESLHEATPPFTEWFGFPVIFRSFKLSVQPGKMILAVAGLLLTYLVGACLDGIWASAGARVYSGEIGQYVSSSGTEFERWKERQAVTDDQELAGMMVSQGAADSLDEAREDLERDRHGAINKLRARIDEKYQPLMNVDERRKAEEKRIEELPEDQRKAERDRLEETLPEMVHRSRAEYEALMAQIDELGTQRIFGQWINAELQFARTAVGALLSGNLVARRGAETEVWAHAINPFVPESFAGALVNMLGAGCWMMRIHPWYFICFVLINLAIWSLIGGGLCRMAAMEATLDQRISIGRALTFSKGKWREFFLAPLIPLVFVGIVGLLLWIGGLGTAIPVVGEIVGPLLFPLALLGGFVIALVVVGATGGAALMWPTIAVEGSDSFDAISRSFSYIYNRPWRSIFYGLVLLVYGSLCYVFLRFFVWLLLICTHVFVSWGVGIFADRPAAGPGMNKLDVMWAQPTFENLRPQFEMINLSRAEPFGAAVIWIFVSLVVVALHAFVISFLLNGFTWVYLLLRRVVDATDLEDVYTEEIEEAKIEQVTEAAPGEAPAAESQPAETPTAETQPPETPEPPSESSSETEPPPPPEG
jgi:hypothetical protein